MQSINRDWTQIVQSDGQLNRQLAQHVEILYTGLHGLSVQRFWLEDGHSYIYKPLPPGEERFREIRAYLQVMPLLTQLAPAPVYPALIAYAAPVDELERLQQSLSNGGWLEPTEPLIHTVCWMIVEDIGVVEHQHSPAVLEQMVDQMAGWHRVEPQYLASLPQTGQKPPLSQAASSLLERWQQVETIMQTLLTSMDDAEASLASSQHSDSTALPWSELAKSLLSALQSDIQHVMKRIAAQPAVLLHGDLHAGNYGWNPQGKLIILDWEHSHAGSLFWDLYHLIDLSHPLFPREMTDKLRHQLVERYWNAGSEVTTAPAHSPHQRAALADYRNLAAFEYDYLLYAMIYSIWMLLLIQSDLQQQPPIWPHALLLAQQYETKQHLQQCLKAWWTAQSEESR